MSTGFGVRPVLCTVAGHDVGAYGFFLGVAFALGWIVALREAKRARVPVERAMVCFAVTAACALVGSRLLWLAANPRALVDGSWFSLRGLQAYGGFIGGLAGAWLGARAARVDAWTWAGCAVPAVALGLAIARVGCFCEGCCYGVVSGAFAPWLDRQPATLYESAGAVALWFVVTRRADPKYRVAAFFVGYAALRFVVEFVRADPDRGFVGPLSTAQLIALVTLVVAGAWALARRQSEKTTP